MKYLVSMVLLFVTSLPAIADEQPSNMELSVEPLLLAVNDREDKGKRVHLEGEREVKPEFETRWFTLNKSHQYFGLASIALATAAVLAPKDENDVEGIHHELAQSATVLAAAAVATGLVLHWEDLTFDRTFFQQPDNWHFLLGSLATLGYAMAVQNAPNEDHAVYGVTGFVMMATAIKLTW